ncbi:hypothetical protein PUNSTDRAFT_121535 [Punctularia strigosozonata HHB-11173 SS5]|uniref:uncharacterized protein n=1 Tax=Punctularia strigosozonata (strain HHB-11173) TaxID=741275 RepID=UPI0004416CC8|nr:uncharacterized protein PUNSTDRAFT_121535 [Punctularia strigosozonata HHB-11173 SS5]EIN07416.1 hypothetical protein PUNSTDRAFT_121535 [Punctularia strigosozonata HHB-11173 SS5]
MYRRAAVVVLACDARQCCARATLHEFAPWGSTATQAGVFEQVEGQFAFSRALNDVKPDKKRSPEACTTRGACSARKNDPVIVLIRLEKAAANSAI